MDSTVSLHLKEVSRLLTQQANGDVSTLAGNVVIERTAPNQLRLYHMDRGRNRHGFIFQPASSTGPRILVVDLVGEKGPLGQRGIVGELLIDGVCDNYATCGLFDEWEGNIRHLTFKPNH